MSQIIELFADTQATDGTKPWHEVPMGPYALKIVIGGAADIQVHYREGKSAGLVVLTDSAGDPVTFDATDMQIVDVPPGQMRVEVLNTGGLTPSIVVRLIPYTPYVGAGRDRAVKGNV